MGSAPHQWQEARETRRGKPSLASWLDNVKASFGKRFRVFVLRRLQQHYSRRVDNAFDRRASVMLDAVTFLSESEESGEVGA